MAFKDKLELVPDVMRNIEVLRLEAYGIYPVELADGRDLLVASIKSYTELLQLLDLNLSTQDIVVTPELLLARDLEFKEAASHRELIEMRVREICELSKRCPDTLLLVGTPYWLEEEKKPRNASIGIRNGGVVHIHTKKISIDSQEFSVFEFSPRRNLAFEGMGTLVCADLVALGREQSVLNVHRRFKPGGWDKHYEGAAPKVLDDSQRPGTIIVSGAWGVGSMLMSSEQDPQEYYRGQLYGCVLQVFKNNPSVREIILCDSTIDNDDLGSFVSERPYNYYFRLLD